ncbi:catalase-related domain-containing protein [Gloeocapsa sp. BRSZ]
MHGLKEAPNSGKDRTPYVEGSVTRQKISRTNDYGQAGDRYRAFSDEERDDLILNLVNALKQCNSDIQERMVEHFTQADPEYGSRVREGLQQSQAM